MKFKVFCVSILFAAIVISCNASSQEILLDTPNGKELTIELALDRKTREKGLMFRKRMPKDHGMLFVFKDNKIRHFWMKNTAIPLSIAFINYKGKVVSIKDMTPFSLDSVSSDLAAKYALEVNQGILKQYGIKVGSMLSIPKELKPQ